MKTLIVKTSSKKYPIYIGQNILSKFSFFKKKHLKNTKNILIVTSNKNSKKIHVKFKKKYKRNKILHYNFARW